MHHQLPSIPNVFQHGNTCSHEQTCDLHVGMFNVPRHGNAHFCEGGWGSNVGTFNFPQHGE